MKKYFMLGLMGLFATLFSVTLTSCGDDDEDGIVGTWVHTDSQSGDGRTMTNTETVIIKGDGTFSISYAGKETYERDTHSWEQRQSGTYTYDEAKGVLTVTVSKMEWKDEETGKWQSEPQQGSVTSTWKVNLSGDKLTIYYYDGDTEGTTYKRK